MEFRGTAIFVAPPSILFIPLSLSSQAHSCLLPSYYSLEGSADLIVSQRRRVHSLVQSDCKQARFTGNRPHRTFIHIPDDDLLLNVFYFCLLALVVLDVGDDEDGRILGEENGPGNAGRTSSRKFV